MEKLLKRAGVTITALGLLIIGALIAGCGSGGGSGDGVGVSPQVVSVVGAAAIGGLLPNARSDKTDTPAQRSAPATDSARHGVPRLAARDSACASCGTVESIRAAELKGNSTGLGAVAGGGVTVSMDDDSFRTVSESTAPTVAVGERVQIANGVLVAHS